MSRILVKEESWSPSQGKRFENCPREQWLAAHGSWNGWSRTAPERAQRLYVLKQLSSIPAWIGKLVHETLMSALKSKVTPTVEQAQEEFYNRMKFDYAQSSRKEFERHPKQGGLIEHALDVPIDPQVLQDARDRGMEMVERGIKSNAFARALMSPEILSIEDKANFIFVGVKCWSVPDLVFRAEDSSTEIVDWKTGRPRDSDRKQLCAYSAFVIERWGDDHGIRATAVYLSEGYEDSSWVFGAEIVSAENEARESIAKMHALDPADEEQWPKTENRALCRYCAFRRECGREDA